MAAGCFGPGGAADEWAAAGGGWEGLDKYRFIMRWVDAGLLNREVLISSWDGFTPAFARDFPALALEKNFPGL